jgi:hypothetical protein
VSPGASRSELVGRHGDGWRARISVLEVDIGWLSVDFGGMDVSSQADVDS